MGDKKLSVEQTLCWLPRTFLRIDLSIDVVLHVIIKNTKFRAHSYGLHFSKKVFLNKTISKKVFRVKGRIRMRKTENVHI